MLANRDPPCGKPNHNPRLEITSCWEAGEEVVYARKAASAFTMPARTNTKKIKDKARCGAVLIKKKNPNEPKKKEEKGYQKTTGAEKKDNESPPTKNKTQKTYQNSILHRYCP